MPPSQQAAAVGTSNYRLLQAGKVEWADIVSKNRVRTLREVVSVKRLSVAEMTKAGVSRGQAEKAWQSVHTPAHELAAQVRRELIAKLKGAGVTSGQVKEAVSTRVVARVGIGAGPSGAAGMPVRPTTPKPSPQILEMPKPVPVFGPSKAAVVIAEGKHEAVAEALRGLFGGKVGAQEVASLVGAPDNARVTVGAFEGRLNVGVDAPGMTAGRTIRKEDGAVVIRNNYFKVEAAKQGKGIGRAVFGRQVEQAALLGVARIETVASRHDAAPGSPEEPLIGYAVWPRFGYDAELHFRDERRQTLPEGLRDAERLSDLMKTAEGRAWWQKNGKTMWMTFDLTPGSLSLRVWESYLKAKATLPTSRAATSP